MPVIKEDEYANIFQITMTESAASTLTYFEINLGLTLFQKKAILINRVIVDWGLTALASITAVGDALIVAITQSNQPTSLVLRDSSCVWKAQKGAKINGTPANLELVNVVETYDLTAIPGGGEFIVPTPLYGAIHGVSLAAAMEVTMRMYFQVIDLKPEQYFELLESRHFYG